MTPILAASVIAIGMAVYLLPPIIAGLRGHASAWGIFALTLLLGWSGIVWIIALIWALSNKGQAVQQTVVVNNHPSGPQQPVQPIYIPVPQQSPASAIDAGSAPVLQLPDDTRVCPACAETIKAAATKCRYCGEQLSPILLSQKTEVRDGG